ncbi:MAG: ATP-binding cassette domain-containing protein, partial [Firmicutes bacterium]|nr:ATP-binding cassette domain-containing protein [Bacillota bacterium]
MDALSVRELSKVYKGGVKALDGVSFSVGEGDFYALLGPNGAGKSTTIGIIAGLVRKTSGTLSVFGRDLDSSTMAAKSLIGLVP